MSKFSMFAGDALVLYATVTNSDGSAFNLAGCALEFFAWAPGKTTLQIDVSIASGGIVVTNSAGGLATVTVPSSQTLGMATTGLVYGLRLTDGLGNPRTLASDTLVVQASA